MTPSERRTACIRLLAEIDQKVAVCEELLEQPVLAYYEVQIIVEQLKIRRDARERVEKMLEPRHVD